MKKFRFKVLINILLFSNIKPNLNFLNRYLILYLLIANFLKVIKINGIIGCLINNLDLHNAVKWEKSYQIESSTVIFFKLFYKKI